MNTSPQNLDSLRKLAKTLEAFAAEREWDQFHTPRDLLIALVGEVGELAEHFQFRSDAEIRQRASEGDGGIAAELADVLIYLVRLADVLGINLGDAAANKVEVNARRYPVADVRGSAEKRP